MQLLYAILADAAQAQPDGKFNIFGGGIETLIAPVFPAMAPTLALVVRLAVASEELGHTHTFHVEVLNPNGNNVLQDRTVREFTTQRSTPVSAEVADVPVTHLFVLTFQGLVFAAPGKHVFHLFVDDVKRGEVSVYLLSQQPSADASDTEEV